MLDRRLTRRRSADPGGRAGPACGPLAPRRSRTTRARRRSRRAGSGRRQQLADLSAASASLWVISSVDLDRLLTTLEAPVLVGSVGVGRPGVVAASHQCDSAAARRRQVIEHGAGCWRTCRLPPTTDRRHRRGRTRRSRPARRAAGTALRPTSPAGGSAIDHPVQRQPPDLLLGVDRRHQGQRVPAGERGLGSRPGEAGSSSRCRRHIPVRRWSASTNPIAPVRPVRSRLADGLARYPSSIGDPLHRARRSRG